MIVASYSLSLGESKEVGTRATPRLFTVADVAPARDPCRTRALPLACKHSLDRVLFFFSSHSQFNLIMSPPCSGSCYNMYTIVYR